MCAVNELQAGMVWLIAIRIDGSAGACSRRTRSAIGRRPAVGGRRALPHTQLAPVERSAKLRDSGRYRQSDRGDTAFQFAGRPGHRAGAHGANRSYARDPAQSANVFVTELP